VPGSAAWTAMDVDDRIDWWVNRVGRVTALLTAAPGLLGALSDRLPVQDTMGVASQGLLLCAIAGEHGVTDVSERVRLIGWVLFERDIQRHVAEGRYRGYDVAAENERTAELSEDLPERGGSRLGVKAGARTLWRLGRSLVAILGELEKRPSGRFYHQALGALPVVGLVGNYFGERAGHRQVARRAATWVRGGAPPRRRPGQRQNMNRYWTGDRREGVTADGREHRVGHRPQGLAPRRERRSSSANSTSGAHGRAFAPNSRAFGDR
jgi:hypothetical protein